MTWPRIEWRPDQDGGGRFWDVDGEFEVMPSEVAAGYSRMARLLSDGDQADPPPDSGPGAPRACLPCVRCGVDLQPVHPDARWHADRNPPRAQPADATVLYGAPGYGSRYDAQDLGDRLAINLCDDCLTVAGRRGRVNLIREREREVVAVYRRWRPEDA